MFLPLPVNTIVELASTRHQELFMTSRRPPSDPDLFLTSSSLPPDPAYMGLRTIVTTGPIGRLLARFDAWREEREDRRLAADQAVATADRLVGPSRTNPSITAVREPIDRDLAA